MIKLDIQKFADTEAYAYVESHSKKPVYTKVESDMKYKVKGDFAIVTFENVPGAEHGAMVAVSAAFPEGFNYNNCHLLSAEFMLTDSNQIVSISSPQPIVINNSGATYDLVADSLSLHTYSNSNNFSVLGRTPISTADKTMKIRVVLMKV